MMAMRRRFEGSFGFNPTILTEVLQEKDYDSAENIIRSTIDATYLNDGQYQEIPFFLVLASTGRPRNLYLANLLLRYGADPSLRVPVISSEDSTIRGHSAIDLLIDFFIEISKAHNETVTLKDDKKWEDYLKVHQVIDLYQRTVATFHDLRSQILEILSDCLQFPEFDIYDPVLMRVMKYSPDLDLVKLLCENGANINVRDNHGRTPLFYLCHFPTETGEKVLDYVLNLPNVQLNTRDCQGYSTLFLCCAHQRLNFARKLLEKDASASILGRITTVPYNEAGEKPITNENCIIVSPLWAACLCTTEDSSWMRKKSLTDAAKAWVACCVDSGFFNTPDITAELWYLINMALNSYEVHCNLNNLDKLNQELVPLLFGRLTCSLQQLSVNAIANHVCQLYLNRSNEVNRFLENSSAATSFKVEKDSAKDSPVCGDEDRKMFLLLQRLPKLLNLPDAFNTRFEIEAVKFLIFKMLDMYCWPVVCKEGCDNEDAFYNDDDLFEFELSDLSDSSESVDFEI